MTHNEGGLGFYYSGGNHQSHYLLAGINRHNDHFNKRMSSGGWGGGEIWLQKADKYCTNLNVPNKICTEEVHEISWQPIL